MSIILPSFPSGRSAKLKNRNAENIAPTIARVEKPTCAFSTGNSSRQMISGRSTSLMVTPCSGGPETS